METTKLTKEHMSIIGNRIQTIVDCYGRDMTIPDLAKAAGMPYAKTSLVLKQNNFWHGIERHEGTKEHPINPIIDYNEFRYLLDYDKIDDLRANK